MPASVKTMERTAIAPVPQGSRGAVETRSYFDAEKAPIQVHVHRLGPGASVRVDGAQNDRCVYVWEGAVSFGGRSLDPRSSLIVEFGTSLDLTAGDDGAALLVFTMTERSAGSRAGGHIQLMPNADVPRVPTMCGNPIGGSLHFIATCATNHLWLHENDFHEGDNETLPHAHSEDEIIFVSEGEIRLGNKVFPRGTAILVSAYTKYGFFSGPNGMKTVCFRGVAPTMIEDDGSIVDETEMWTSSVGMPHPVALEPA